VGQTRELLVVSLRLWDFGHLASSFNAVDRLHRPEDGNGFFTGSKHFSGLCGKRRLEPGYIAKSLRFID
jgi:hypothetical protein